MTAAETTYLLGSAVFDGVQSGVRQGCGVLVRDGRVAAVGTPSEVCPPDARHVDLGDAVLLPGFVDAHTHVTIRPGEGDQHGQLQGPPAWQAVRGVDNVRRMLASGVTTARIMTEDHDIDFHFKSAIARGEIVGPRLRVAGRGLSPPGKHGGAAGGVAGPEDLRVAVRANADKGADHIKIFTTGGVSSTNTSLEESNYSAKEIRAIVEAAAERGLTVSAHAHGGTGVQLAVDNGVRSIEHGALLTRPDVERIAANHAWVVLTNTILFHPAGIEQGDAREPAILDKVHQARGSMTTAIGLIREAAIPVALGTDSMHGLFGYEMQWLVEHGWTPQEALSAATKGGAQLLGLADIGTLAVGAHADIVALARNPLDDITAVYDVTAVFQRGHQVITSDQFARAARADTETHREE